MFETGSTYNPTGTTIYVDGKFVMAGSEAEYGSRGMTFLLGGTEDSPALVVQATGFEDEASDWFSHEQAGSSAVRSDGSGFHSGRYPVATGECMRFAQLLPGASSDGRVSGPAIIGGTFHQAHDGACELSIFQGHPDAEDLYDFALVDGRYEPIRR